MDIFITSVNGGRDIMQYQNNESTSHKYKEGELVQPVQMNISQNNTYRKELSWLHFYNSPRAQAKQQALNY